MIGNTAIDILMRKNKLLIDSVAWFESHTEVVKKIIIELIQVNQLTNKGVDKFNDVIGLYSPVTEMINPKKIAGTPFTLDDTGQFYRSMFVVVMKQSIIIEATANKMEEQEWWSTDILGLNEESLQIYITLIRKNYILFARKTLGIN